MEQAFLTKKMTTQFAFAALLEVLESTFTFYLLMTAEYRKLWLLWEKEPVSSPTPIYTFMAGNSKRHKEISYRMSNL